eukprot:TRINITY_DN4761_c0_g2_i2.p1 TRINITY_DN4761_c0_g2~~TRINITY_DN4761_c0_g2_i2.p1  ORF type:complete len:419 (+),score=89.56 TRINITY_DN4761_c0_g2_i2:176-1432(+)
MCIRDRPWLLGVFLPFALAAHEHHHEHHHEYHHEHAGHGHHHHLQPNQSLSAIFISNLVEACPWLLLGLVCTSLMQIFGPTTNTINGFLQHTVPAVAALLGMLVPLCSCGALPIALGMIEQGVSPRVVVAFLTAAQSAGLDSALLTAGLLGFNIAGARLLGALLLAIAAGSATPAVALPHGAESSSPDPPSQPNTNKLRGLSDWVGLAELITVNTCALFDQVVVSLSLGILATSICTLWASSFAAVAVSAPQWILRIVVPALSLPLQLCEHGTVAFASALHAAGMSPGTAFAFLVTAPATNLASLALVLRHGGGAQAVRRIGLAIVLSAAAMATAFDMAGASFEPPDAADLVPEVVTVVSVVLVGAMGMNSIKVRWSRQMVAPQVQADRNGGCCSLEEADCHDCCETEQLPQCAERDL